MKPMACASLAANTASTPGRCAVAATLPGALRSRISRRGFGQSLRQRFFPETVPAPGRARIVAADESEMLPPLRDQMLRDRDARLVIVESCDRIDRRCRQVPGLDDRNPALPQQPRAVFRRGRSHHDDRFRPPRQQRRQHAVLALGIVTRLRQDHRIAERLQLVGQALHRIGKDRIGDGRHQHADRIGAGARQRAGNWFGT